jgi:hypothetical protein
MLLGIRTCKCAVSIFVWKIKNYWNLCKNKGDRKEKM